MGEARAGGDFEDRRRFPRLATQMVYKPVGLSAGQHRRGTSDIGLGGMRAFSDDRLTAGTRLEIELQMPDGDWMRCWARVAWVDALPHSEEARFDVGLEFFDVADADARRLASILSH